ncbi:glutamic acid-rich protein-like [Lingula anatina]|uniref:Glutamic acid-rich protein-like n=1 Tax=Lingula anatina TaxID=7574 RepID=A0A1S3HCC8_LINAN|nr:glutamic acid-rich protein-like [Lingula anatina]|eukprot:XP_013383166.1 glutamic acid-rich protein-like [Lingula anatina]
MLDMAKREKVVQTYGRHRNRVITTNDLWSSGEERGKTLFSSSEDSSLSITDRSRNVSSRSFNSFSKTRSVDKHSANKENRSRKPRRAKVEAVDRLFALTDSANSSQNTSNVGCRKALRDRNGIFDIKSDEKVSKKPQTDKRKQPRRAKRTENKKTKNAKGSSKEPAAFNLKSDTSDLKIEASHFNFSQFDNYSLVLSDSPLKEGEKISGRDSLLKELSGITVQQTPDIVTRGKPALRNVTSVETSTPNIYHKAKRTDAAGKIKPEEISLIEHFDSNPNTPSQESKEQEYAEISAGVEKLSLGDSSKNSKDVRSGNTYQVTDRQELTYALRKCQVVLDRCKNLTQNDECEDANCESTKTCDTDGIGLKSCEIMVQKITDSFVTRRRRPACKSSNGKHASLDSIVELSFDASADLFDTDTPSEHSDAELADLPSPKGCYMLRGQGPVTRNRNVSGDSIISAISEIEEEEEVETDEDEELVSENDDQEQASDVEQGETEEEEDSSEEEDEDECKAEVIYWDQGD